MFKQKQKYSLFTWKEILLSVFFCFAVIISYAGLMSYLEKNLILKARATDSFDILYPKIESVREYLLERYLNPNSPQKITPRVLGIQTQGIDSPEYRAKLTKKAYPSIRIYPNKAITFWVGFKNTGTKTWYNTGKNFIALNVTGPAGRRSLFKYSSWKEYYYRPCRLSNQQVKPGETGRFIFVLKAPDKPGDYTEKFGLVAEDLTWISGGEFGIPIHVVYPYEAGLVALAYPSIKIEPQKAITFWADFKNRGTKIWYNTGKNFVALNVTNPAGRLSPFKHDLWKEYYYRPTRLSINEIKPGQVGRFKFALQAPGQEGEYNEKFGLVAEDLMWLPGGEFTIPIVVQKNSPPPTNTSPQEATIRIGLFNTTEPITVKANGSYEIRDSNNTLLKKTSGQTATVTFSNNQYAVSVADFNRTTDKYLEFVPENQNTILEISSYENRPAWNSELNDNLFRGTLEIRYSTKTQKLWAINELPMESYLRGLAEVTNDQPKEYLKSLIIAARTYAQYNINVGGKHPDDNFDLDDSANDQVYRGYGFELRAPNVVKVVEETRGLMILYNNQVVVTPYFSHSDGRTRSWDEVWSGGPKPWLVSKIDPYCSGLTLSGHGVGLSALGAKMMAENGSTYDKILKYYYTGITIKKIY